MVFFNWILRVEHKVGYYAMASFHANPRIKSFLGVPVVIGVGVTQPSHYFLWQGTSHLLSPPW